jgi:ABC-2 type transport system ATP-binding protein
MTMSQMPAISVRNLTKQFDGFTAVDDIHFDVQHGEIFGFLGPNGSGKTTTIRMMLGLMKPTQGEIRVLGTRVTQGTREIRPRVGYMSQKFSLYNDLTVLQNLNFYGQSYGLENDERGQRVQEAIEIADLGGHEHTPTKDLSGGWRQRLALGAAILHHPEILFLDEPTAGVDPISRRAFWDLLYKLVAEGKTVFITTHYMDEAEHCHRLALLQRGRIIAYGTPEEIKRETISGKILEIEASPVHQALHTLQEAQRSGKIQVSEIELYGTLIHIVNGTQEKRTIRRLLRKANLELHSLTAIEPSLEDVFIASMQNNPSGETS